MDTPEPADLEQLRAEFPGWRLAVMWTTANSGPDIRFLVAIRNGMVLTARSASGLRAEIGLTERPRTAR